MSRGSAATNLTKEGATHKIATDMTLASVEARITIELGGGCTLTFKCNIEQGTSIKRSKPSGKKYGSNVRVVGVSYGAGSKATIGGNLITDGSRLFSADKKSNIIVYGHIEKNTVIDIDGDLVANSLGDNVTIHAGGKVTIKGNVGIKSTIKAKKVVVSGELGVGSTATGYYLLCGDCEITSQPDSEPATIFGNIVPLLLSGLFEQSDKTQDFLTRLETALNIVKKLADEVNSEGPGILDMRSHKILRPSGS